MPSTISAVVPAYRAEHYIRRCLDALLAAGFKPAEIVVVDDASPDNTAAQCQRAGIPPVSLPGNVGAAQARNVGAKAAKGDILFFVDADVVVHTNARDVVLRFMDNEPRYAAIFGTYDDQPEYPSRVSRIRNLFHRHVHESGSGDAVTFWTGCGAIRRRDFFSVGGFDPNQKMMEDIKLGMELVQAGRKIRLAPELQGTHLKKWGIRSIVKTDLFHRALPWARLQNSPLGAGLPETLNINMTSKLSVLAVAASLAGLAIATLAPIKGLSILTLCLLALATLNHVFLAKLLRHGGWADAAVAFPVLWVHYFCGGLGFAWVRIGFDKLARSAIQKNNH